MAGVYFYDNQWFEECPKLTGPTDHSFWLGSSVFDGARVFQGLAPDLGLHVARLFKSACSMGLAPKETETEVERLCVEGIRKLPKTTELYIRPMFFARGGFVVPEPESTEFCLSVYDAPLPEFDGIKIRFSAWRRPAQDMALTNAKAGALYPNSSRALREALELGFDNAVVKDANGNIAELATANLWMVKDNVASTPALTGTFLAGVTRYRVACLLRENGIAVEETTLTESDLRNADEIFSTGNFAKVQPVVQLEDRTLEIGPICKLAYQLYFEYAKGFDVFATQSE